MYDWNPWHGCQKISAGCLNCYMFRRDSEFNKDSTIVSKTADFNLPIRKHRDGSYKLSGKYDIYTCLTSDFFLDKADDMRIQAWEMIKERSDLNFIIITKRIDRFFVNLPQDFKDGYENVTICATCENQKETDKRLPLLLQYPIKHRKIIHEPILEEINIEKYLESGKIEEVICGGESGENARVCDFNWILSIREQCKKFNTDFYFKQTGANFKKNGKIYSIPRKFQMSQAKKANINLFLGDNI